MLKKLDRKKLLFLGGVSILVVLLLIDGGWTLWRRNQKPADQTTTTAATKKKRLNDPVNVIAVSDRPYLTIKPLDEHNIQIRIEAVKKPATSADYELEYQTETNLEGAIGSMDIGSSFPILKEILLGTRSAGGATRYHENVQGGTFLVRLAGPENYAVKSDWRFILNPKKETSFSSKDVKFTIDSKDLAKERVLIIYNSPGYPPGLSGTPISDIYTWSSATGAKVKGTVTIKANEDPAGASLMGWDGQTWQTIPAKADGKTLTATNVELVPLYVVAKK
jgi:hypothetical protein